MKVSEVIDKALRGELRWIDAAGILGVSDRQMRRWKQRVLADKAGGLQDRRQGRKPGNHVPEATARHIVELYQGQYEGFNVKHFHEELVSTYATTVSYSYVKRLLHETGCVRRHPKRGVYRRKRERKPMAGMLVHLDGSKHRWFESDDGTMQDLLVYLDDATGEIVAAQFVPEEATATVLSLLKELVRTRGTFGALYTDRASHFVCTPNAQEGPDRSKKTQVEQILDDLGIELICAFSPQARGRSERMWRTLQGRLPQELRRAHVTTYEQANAYLRQKFLKKFNAMFAVAPAVEGTAFLPVQRADLDAIVQLRYTRVVAKDHTVRFANRAFQLPKGSGFLAGRKVDVRVDLDGIVSIYLAKRLLATFAAKVDPNLSQLEAA